MDIKTLEQALKLQNDLTARLTQSMESQRTGKMPNIEVTLKEMETIDCPRPSGGRNRHQGAGCSRKPLG